MSDQRTPMQIINLPASTTAAGTKVQVSATAYGCRFVHIAAMTSNTGIVYVGGSTVSSSVHLSKLYAGDEIDIPIEAVNRVWYDVSVNSEGIQAGYLA